MEVFYYRCPVCGFFYQVPSYWMSYTAEETYLFPHIDPKTGKQCSCAELKYQEENA